MDSQEVESCDFGDDLNTGKNDSSGPKTTTNDVEASKKGTGSPPKRGQGSAKSPPKKKGVLRVKSPAKKGQVGAQSPAKSPYVLRVKSPAKKKPNQEEPSKQESNKEESSKEWFRRGECDEPINEWAKIKETI
ncbi:fibronectin type III domain-containing protein 1 isoform X1 [Sesbania bispinosa]|nr:fibronectin type III domain-containing protein 1 isoform X1 [Sesbania bispinosa]